jgi:hypothetical protein
MSIDQRSNPFSMQIMHLGTFHLLLRNTPYCAELEVQSLSLLEVMSHERSNGVLGHVHPAFFLCGCLSKLLIMRWNSFSAKVEELKDVKVYNFLV